MGADFLLYFQCFFNAGRGRHFLKTEVSGKQSPRRALQWGSR